ncbi:MAG TPA: sensor histidine kinase [Candidatus Angelobacter sp.]|nr:sensor histidine kinase [Candidatus Angelobacter sp.]
MASQGNTKLDAKRLDDILSTMVKTVNSSRDEIFEIGEQSRRETESLMKELETLKEKVTETIKEHDELTETAHKARAHLAQVSGRFDKFKEEDIRKAYEKANEIQFALSTVEYQEKQLRERRGELERRLLSLRGTSEKAEKLAGQVSVVLNYLTGDLQSVGELIADARQKQELGLKIIEAQEEERRRLSREIHDGPAQLLAHVLLGSELIERMYRDKGPDETKKEIHRFRDLVRNALFDVRRIIYDLRPMSLDDLGLVPTVEKYLNRIEEQYPEISLSFRSIGEVGRLPTKLEVALFRLIQEGVQNACKHSGGTSVRVLIEAQGEKIVLLIKDNGKGFQPEKRHEESFGLLGMKERVEILEGRIDIQPDQEGTTIIAQIPLKKEDEA